MFTRVPLIVATEWGDSRQNIAIISYIRTIVRSPELFYVIDSDCVLVGQFDPIATDMIV